jgi:hypothetical protein
MRTPLISFAVFVLIHLTNPMMPPASSATLTCVTTHEVTDDEWDIPFVKRLRDQGLQRPEHPICATALLSGEIVTGDAKGLEELIQANIPFFWRLALNSNGGDVSEAMQIGRLVRHYYLETEAPGYWLRQGPHLLLNDKITEVPGARCVSACFFAWLGGVNRTGDLLGIHRPFPSAIEMQKLSPAEADRLYRSLSEKILAYLSEMGAAPHWLDDMLKIPPDELLMIPENQIQDELGPVVN